MARQTPEAPRLPAPPEELLPQPVAMMAPGSGQEEQA